MKDDGSRDAEKKKEIENLLEVKLDENQFHQVFNLSKKITDYTYDEDDKKTSGRAGQSDDDADGAVDDEMGVVCVTYFICDLCVLLLILLCICNVFSV